MNFLTIITIFIAMMTKFGSSLPIEESETTVSSNQSSTSSYSSSTSSYMSSLFDFKGLSDRFSAWSSGGSTASSNTESKSSQISQQEMSATESCAQSSSQSKGISETESYAKSLDYEESNITMDSKMKQSSNQSSAVAKSSVNDDGTLGNTNIKKTTAGLSTESGTNVEAKIIQSSSVDDCNRNVATATQSATVAEMTAEDEKKEKRETLIKTDRNLGSGDVEMNNLNQEKVKTDNINTFESMDKSATSVVNASSIKKSESESIDAINTTQGQEMVAETIAEKGKRKRVASQTQATDLETVDKQCEINASSSSNIQLQTANSMRNLESETIDATNTTQGQEMVEEKIIEKGKRKKVASKTQVNDPETVDKQCEIDASSSSVTQSQIMNETTNSVQGETAAIESAALKETTENEKKKRTATKAQVENVAQAADVDVETSNVIQDESESTSILETINKSVSTIVSTITTSTTSQNTEEISSVQEGNEVNASEAVAKVTSGSEKKKVTSQVAEESVSQAKESDTVSESQGILESISESVSSASSSFFSSSSTTESSALKSETISN